MTTQNIEPEHSDVDESVVEHSLAFQAPTPPSLPVVPTEAQTEGQGEGQANQEQAEDTPTGPASENLAVRDTTNVEDPGEVKRADNAEPQHEPLVEEVLSSSAEISPGEEEVRPFTAFIEEFRQTEAGFNAALPEAQTESFTLLAPAEEPGEPEFVMPWENIPVEPLPTPVETTGTEEAPATTATPGPSSVRPVSPLLRPASRLRMPRHGSGRQREEIDAETVAPVEQPTATPTGPTALEEQQRPARRYRFDRPAPSNGPAVVSSPQSRTEENKEVANRGSIPAPVRTDNGQGIIEHTQTGERETQTIQQGKPTAGGDLQNEQVTSKQPAVQESPVTENVEPVPPTTISDNDRRRRHGQDRQRGKEQNGSPSPAPAGAPGVQEPVAAINAQLTLTSPAATEPVTPQKEEVSPEDLPPLEYSELQKASSRRRRRRHPGNAVAPASAAGAVLPASAKSVTPELPSSPAPAQAPPIVLPRTSTNTPTTQNQYAITSGYTVNQMNQQGIDGTTPFMGPDPSPARGSMAAQNVRSIRTDVQRAPAYPVRTTEATSASVHQLANIVSQAIQTQTDRMVAELRRVNQSPTNISVAMPPFPSTERVGVFVDVANLLYSARTQRLTINFGKLLDFLRGNRRLVRAQAYCPTSPQPGDEQMFLHAVKGLGYRITTKNYKTFSSGAKKADLDLDLCMDVVRLVDGRAVDCIVLVSGDSDFMPMLDYCSDHGVRVEVAAFDEAMSAVLRQSCDLFINLSMLEEIRG